MMITQVARVLNTTVAEIIRAMKTLANVGRKTRYQGIVFSSDDIDRIKEFLANNPKR